MKVSVIFNCESDEELAELLQKVTGGTTSPKKSTPKKGKGKAEKPKDKEPKEEENLFEEEGEGEGEGEEELTLDDVRKALKAYAKENSKEKAMKKLKKFAKSGKVADLDEDDYADLVAKLT